MANHHRVLLWVSDSAPPAILETFNVPYRTFQSLSFGTEAEKIRNELASEKCGVALFNMRRIDNDILSRFRNDNLKLICIDELGGRHLDCDVIINPSIVSKYHNYSSGNQNIRIFTSPLYLSMSPEFMQAHKRDRDFRGEIQTVSVCMGGVDRTGATLRIMDALAHWKPAVRKNILLGGGFLHTREVYKKTAILKDHHFFIHQNISDIASLFLESDVAFTAGGNVLAELACLGTPAIVLYEDDHERENGIAFEALGFGFCVGAGIEATTEAIVNALQKYEDEALRRTHSPRGKELVDGKGAGRILDIIRELVISPA